MDTAPASTEPAWRDLALNRPGELLRRRAAEEPTDNWAWLAGADGEEIVGRCLDQLPASWHAINSIPVADGPADIDHLVIGPGGVFTINTKNHSERKVWVGDYVCRVDELGTAYPQKARFEAKTAAARLSAACDRDVPVDPLIVVLAKRLKVDSRNEWPVVLEPEAVVDWLCRRLPWQSPQLVATIYEYARRSTTWTRAVSTRR